MNNEPTASALTDSQIVERLAKFMDGKWKNHGLPFGSASRILAKKCVEGDWNLWREVELVILKNIHGVFQCEYLYQLGCREPGLSTQLDSMEADLRTRCLALLSALDTLKV